MAFDKDVTSKTISGKKVLSPWSPQLKTYKDNELEELIVNTKFSSHNELWISSNNAEIIGGYLCGKNKSFVKFMKSNGYEVHLIPKFLT